MMDRVDGNALAGVLSEFFAGDPTAMSAVCGSCGARGALAEAPVERDDVASIVRCASCTRTLLTILRVNGVVRVRIGCLGEMLSAP